MRPLPSPRSFCTTSSRRSPDQRRRQRASPLLAESWEVSPDLKTYTFKAAPGVKFQNGEPFTAAAVSSRSTARAAKKHQQDKRTFAATTQVVDDYTVVLLNKEIDPDLLFVLGQPPPSSWSPKAPIPTPPSPWAPALPAAGLEQGLVGHC